MYTVSTTLGVNDGMCYMCDVGGGGYLQLRDAIAMGTQNNKDVSIEVDKNDYIMVKSRVIKMDCCCVFTCMLPMSVEGMGRRKSLAVRRR